MSTIGGLLGLAGALGGLTGVASLVGVVTNRTKIRTDAADQIADTSVGLLKPLHEEIDRLRSNLRTAETELDDLRRQMRQMTERHAEAEALRSKARAAEQETAALRDQISRLYGELGEKDRALVERDRTIAALRAQIDRG